MSALRTPEQSVGRTVLVHPLLIRLTHWINATAILMMVGSGWGIYNASPLLPFRFPPWATLGGWLGGAIIWHLGAMWMLVDNALVYFGYGLLRRHFQRSFLPITPRMLQSDLRLALAFRLHHESGMYNAVQRLLYVVVLLLGVMALLSGLALWKPVQLQILDTIMGGYPVVRWVHFLSMSGIVAFVVMHLALVAVVPKVLPSMITGRARIAVPEASSPS